jgi:hypothetical protein
MLMPFQLKSRLLLVTVLLLFCGYFSPITMAAEKKHSPCFYRCFRAEGI